MSLIPTVFSDHSIRGVPVLPGAWIIATAAAEHPFLRDISYDNMVLLSQNQPSSLSVNVANGLLRLTDDSGQSVARAHVCNADYTSTVLTEDDGAGKNSSKLESVSPNGKALLDSVSGESLYLRLSAQGNEYGKRFQGIQSIDFQQDLGRAKVRIPAAVEERSSRLAVLIDCCTHALAVVGGLSSTYILDKIGSSFVNEPGDLPGEMDMSIRMASRFDSGCAGDCIVRNAAGEILLELRGVQLKLIDGPLVEKKRVAIASNFALDPLEEVTEFWSGRMGLPLSVGFADYNQVYQALLSPDGVFDNNASAHYCFIRIADWARKKVQTRQQQPNMLRLPAGIESYQLPDGREVASLNPYETAYLYQEIFNDLAYRRYDVTILENDTVIDIGANIGLFTLFAVGEAENVRSIAIEPSPIVAPILRANTDCYAPGSVVIEAGASSGTGTANFTAYRHSSVFSSFDADEKADEGAIRTVIRNTLYATGQTDEALVDEAVEQLLSGRMNAEHYECRLVSVSDVIREQGLLSIGLLKIDAEKSEDAILDGIDPEHWAIIDQVIIEVHLQGGRSDKSVIDMLASYGFEVTRDEEDLLSDSGLITLYAIKPERKRRNLAEVSASSIDDSAELLVNAVKKRSTVSGVPLNVILCPSDVRDPAIRDKCVAVESSLTQALENVSSVAVCRWDKFAKWYPVEFFSDAISNEMAHIPYTLDWYAATGSALYRRHVLEHRSPAKVLVCDCDNTLWDGVVGEEGAQGVRFTQEHLELHRYIKGLIDEGIVFTLASKNAEQDVREVFDMREDFCIDWSDIVASRINWQPKSDNMLELASELNLGLDSFVFLDDSPVEIGEMRLALPEVLSLQVPASQIVGFLKNIWPLDGREITDEDRQRAARYKVEGERRKVRGITSSIREFVENLQLDVRIESLEAKTLDRVSQMSQRTNQFNVTTIRRDRAEMQSVLDSGFRSDVITVSDRFGDYGITGLVIYEIAGASLVVDTLLLSCRVLGRGVEHEVIRHLGRVANEAEVELLEIPYRATRKNEPVKKFLMGLDGNRIESESGFVSQINAHHAKNIPFFVSDERGDEGAGENTDQLKNTFDVSDVSSASLSPSIQKNQSADNGPSSRSELWQDIASRFYSASTIATAVAERLRRERPSLATVYRAASTETEKKLTGIWEEMLGLEGIGVDDNFFDLGGTSLRVVQMAARLQQEYGGIVSVTDVFDSPNVATLAAAIESEGKLGAVVSSRDRGAARRGHQVPRRSRNRPS